MATKKKSRKKAGTKKAAKKKAAGKKTPAKKKTAKQRRADAREKSKVFARDRLAAQLVGKLIEELRDLQNVWSKTPEAEQEVIIARITDTVRRSVTEAALVMSGQGYKAVVGNLFSVTFKDGVRAVVTCPPGSDMRHELADRATQDIVMVFADPQQFLAGLDEIKPDKDQPDLIENTETSK